MEMGFVGGGWGWCRGGRRGVTVRRCGVDRGGIGDGGFSAGEKQDSASFFRLSTALKRAVNEERYGDAARIRDELAEVRELDPLLRARDALKVAVDEEDYKRAAALRDQVNELMRLRTKGEGFSLNRLLHLVVTDEHCSRVVSTCADGSVLFSHTEFTQKNTLFAQPSWSPSGDYFAVSRVSVNPAKGTVQSNLIVFDVFENNRLLDWKVDTAPFYFFWSPCGTQLTYLGSTKGVLNFYHVNVQAREPPRQICEGGPFFYDMSPSDPLAIIAHSVGKSKVELISLSKDPRKQIAKVLTPTAGNFRAPQWHPLKSKAGNPQVLFTVKEKDKHVLKSMDIMTAESSDLLQIPKGTINHILCKDGTKLAVLVRTDRGEELNVVEGPFDAYGDENMTSSSYTVNLSVPFSRILCFFWSPDSKKILYLTGPTTALSDSPCRWNVFDFASNTLARFEEHSPSRTFLQLFVPFFDQYALSHRFWAPDSRAFCYCGMSNRLGGKSGPTFSWVQRLPDEMLGTVEEVTPEGRSNQRRIVKAPDTPMPDPVLRDSHLCTWSI